MTGAHRGLTPRQYMPRVLNDRAAAPWVEAWVDTRPSRHRKQGRRRRPQSSPPGSCPPRRAGPDETAPRETVGGRDPVGAPPAPCAPVSPAPLRRSAGPPHRRADRWMRPPTTRQRVGPERRREGLPGLPGLPGLLPWMRGFAKQSSSTWLPRSTQRRPRRSKSWSPWPSRGTSNSGSSGPGSRSSRLRRSPRSWCGLGAGRTRCSLSRSSSWTARRTRTCSAPASSCSAWWPRSTPTPPSFSMMTGAHLTKQ